MDEVSAQVFLPSREGCFERLRLARFGEAVTCVHCGSEGVVKRGTTGKDAQQYWCKACETHSKRPHEHPDIDVTIPFDNSALTCAVVNKLRWEPKSTASELRLERAS